MVASWKEVAEATQKETNNDNARLGLGNWNSMACMRLIHALVDHDEQRHQGQVFEQVESSCWLLYC
jgi:hypothetical protein